MKRKEKRKRVNQGINSLFITTKTVIKVEYTPRTKSKEDYEPSEECLRKLAKEIADKHRCGESKFAKILIEELSK
jgi:hypothetical protein